MRCNMQWHSLYIQLSVLIPFLQRMMTDEILDGNSDCFWIFCFFFLQMEGTIKKSPRHLQFFQLFILQQ